MSSVQLVEMKQGVCITPSQKMIHFMRYHFVVSHQEKQDIFYLYENLNTYLWFVHHDIVDNCLSTSGWSKTIHTAFKKYRAVLGINPHDRDPYPMEEEMIEKIQLER